jgi:amphi-Trp domain-containing protein
MSKKEAKIKASLELPQVVERLDEVLRSLRGGTVSFVNCDHSLALTPTGPIKFEISATKKAHKESISLELSWRLEEEDDKDEGDDADESDKAPEFKITGGPCAVERSGPTA